MRCFGPGSVRYSRDRSRRAGPMQSGRFIQVSAFTFFGTISETHGPETPAFGSTICSSARRLPSVWSRRMWTARCAVGRRRAIMRRPGSSSGKLGGGDDQRRPPGGTEPWAHGIARSRLERRIADVEAFDAANVALRHKVVETRGPRRSRSKIALNRPAGSIRGPSWSRRFLVTRQGGRDDFAHPRSRVASGSVTEAPAAAAEGIGAPRPPEEETGM
jgi:hypothetical protein